LRPWRCQTVSKLAAHAKSIICGNILTRWGENAVQKTLQVHGLWGLQLGSQYASFFRRARSLVVNVMVDEST
jgi:hypothetical protein